MKCGAKSGVEQKVAGHMWEQQRLNLSERPWSEWKWHATRKTTWFSNLCLLLAFHFSGGETSARAAWKQDLPSGWAEAVHDCFSSTDHSVGHLIPCPPCEDVHKTQPTSLSAAFQLQVLPVKESFLFILLCFPLWSSCIVFFSCSCTRNAELLVMVLRDLVLMLLV